MVRGLCKNEVVSLPKFPGLPEGYEVVEVHHEYRYDAFAFKLYHESFDPVLPGMEVPLFIGIGDKIIYEVFDLKKIRDKRKE